MIALHLARRIKGLSETLHLSFISAAFVGARKSTPLRFLYLITFCSLTMAASAQGVSPFQLNYDTVNVIQGYDYESDIKYDMFSFNGTYEVVNFATANDIIDAEITLNGLAGYHYLNPNGRTYVSVNESSFSGRDPSGNGPVDLTPGSTTRDMTSDEIDEHFNSN